MLYKLKKRLAPKSNLPLSTRSPLDVWMDNRLNSGQSTCILQIGASDGSRNDPLRPYLQEPNALLRAALVEPLPTAFKCLQNLYGPDPRLVLINAAIDEKRGNRKIYTTTEDCPYVSD